MKKTVNNSKVIVALSSIVPILNPSGYTSKDVYANIKNGMPDLIERAIKIRSQYG